MLDAITTCGGPSLEISFGVLRISSRVAAGACPELAEGRGNDTQSAVTEHDR